jgi:hypothetical protein
MTSTVTLYVDYRSPFSYLVKDEAYALARPISKEPTVAQSRSGPNATGARSATSTWMPAALLPGAA